MISLKNKAYRRLLLILLVAAVVMGTLASASYHSSVQAMGSRSQDGLGGEEQGGVLGTASPTSLYLPAVMKHDQWISPFGIETNSPMQQGGILIQRADELGTNWVRMNGRISWWDLQPVEGEPIDWSQLASFENELIALNEQGMTPIVVVDDYPRWATAVPNSCSPIREDKLTAFADFAAQLAARYSVPPYNVHHWELGNEPDVDPSLVPLDYLFGCWGDIDDTYYGGEYYGEMVKVVSPAIRAVDPDSKLWIGGLLLDSPNTTTPGYGKPENFLEGILRAGAADYFDIVGYHVYPGYIGERIDYDMGSTWLAWGGNTIGKARFLRSVMAQYGVDKPVFLNETGLMCPDHPPYDIYCLPPTVGFYQAQADHVVRTFTRGLSEDIMGYAWYTLDGPGWRSVGLLDGTQSPKLVYDAYQQLTKHLTGLVYVGAVNYHAEVEGYAFDTGSHSIHVVWARADRTHTISIPVANLMEVYDQYGNVVPKTLDGANYTVEVDFSPIYIKLKR